MQENTDNKDGNLKAVASVSILGRHTLPEEAYMWVLNIKCSNSFCNF